MLCGWNSMSIQPCGPVSFRRLYRVRTRHGSEASHVAGQRHSAPLADPRTSRSFRSRLIHVRRAAAVNEKPKRSPAEVWALLEKEAIQEEADRVAALSPEELDAELAAQGIDPKAARERGAALAARLLAERAKKGEPRG